MASFKAFLIEQAGDRVTGSSVAMDDARLDPGSVTIRVAYSSINYKDALAATGRGRIIRRFPCIGGIDLAGVVEHSDDARFAPGAAVIATSYDIGVAHHGGYAELARVPGDWVVPLPAGLSLFEAMALGTAGFTAALAVVRMEENGLRPDHGPVLVNGATGGVGSLAIDMLAQLGYQVTALTGKENQADYLRALGASEVLLRSSLDLAHLRALDKARWAGAVDSLGGDMLAWILSTMQPDGVVASIGLAAGTQLQTTVMPFILRGVSLLGIDSAYAGGARRATVWQRLADDLRPPHLLAMTQRIGLDELPGAFDALLAGQAHGRVVVDVAGAGQDVAHGA